jgi:hypothetical protein
MQNYPSPEMAQITDGICFLAKHADCPERQRELLFLWLQDARGGDETAYQENSLCTVINALITISHSNAAFSLAPTPPFYFGKPEIDIEDRGGYFAAKKAVSTLIGSDFVPESLRLSLANFALARIDRDERGIEKLLINI